VNNCNSKLPLLLALIASTTLTNDLAVCSSSTNFVVTLITLASFLASPPSLVASSFFPPQATKSKVKSDKKIKENG